MSNDNPTADHVVIDEEPTGTGPDKPAIEKNLKARSTWIRLVFMLVFCFLGWLATMVATAVVVLGFLWVLFTGETNERLKVAGNGIAQYIYQIIAYLTYNSDERPFPFDAGWPTADGNAAPDAGSATDADESD